MSILWQSQKPLTAHQITEVNEKLSIYTVQQVLQRLLKMEFIKVAEINYSKNVLARFYAPNLRKIDYMRFVFGSNSPLELASNLIESSNNEELDALEELINKQRSSLNR